MDRQDPGKCRSKDRLLLLLLKGWRRMPPAPETCRKTLTVSCLLYLSSALPLSHFTAPAFFINRCVPRKVDKRGLCEVMAAVKQKLSPLQQVSQRPPQHLFLDFSASFLLHLYFIIKLGLCYWLLSSTSNRFWFKGYYSLFLSLTVNSSVLCCRDDRKSHDTYVEDQCLHGGWCKSGPRWTDLMSGYPHEQRPPAGLGLSTNYRCSHLPISFHGHPCSTFFSLPSTFQRELKWNGGIITHTHARTPARTQWLTASKEP